MFYNNMIATFLPVLFVRVSVFIFKVIIFALLLVPDALGHLSLRLLNAVSVFNSG